MKNSSFKRKYHLSDLLWDAWCIGSVVGIWPRFIEPNRLSTSKIKLPIKGLPPPLSGLKILQLSDLHFSTRVSNYYLNKLKQQICSLQPDLIVFTGDILCYSRLDDPLRLKGFLKALKAPFGCFAVFGNHDYEQTVSINGKGEYDVVENSTSLIGKGFSRLFTNTRLTGTSTSAARAVKTNRELEELLKETPLQVLHNASCLLPIKGSYLNVCGLGEYTLGQCLPEVAFKNYNDNFPGVVLAHNPDSAPLLAHYPGNLILSGHTHGGQINLPWLWKKFTLLENMQYLKGLFCIDDKWLYVNRGCGSVMQFRWFAVPEIALFTLVKG